jgi:hypothetical protein
MDEILPHLYYRHYQRLDELGLDFRFRQMHASGEGMESQGAWNLLGQVKASNFSTIRCLYVLGSLTIMVVGDLHFPDYSAILDFVLALLPWVILMRMTMRRRERLGVAVAMSLGAM